MDSAVNDAFMKGSKIFWPSAIVIDETSVSISPQDTAIHHQYPIVAGFAAMAVRSIAILLYVVLLVTLASVMEEASKCGNGWCPCMLAVAAPAKNPMRKLLHGEEEEGLKGFESLDSRHQNDLVGWDLRMAPSGPDPLHHNGVGSKKPRTP